MLQHAAAAAIGAAQRSASVRALGLVPRYGQLQPHHPADAESETRGEDGNQSEHEISRPMFDPVEQQTETRDNDFAVPGASDEQPSEKEPRVRLLFFKRCATTLSLCH